MNTTSQYLSTIIDMIIYSIIRFLLAEILLYFMIPDFTSIMSIQTTALAIVILMFISLVQCIVIQNSDLKTDDKIIVYKLLLNIDIGIYFLLLASYVLTIDHLVILICLLIVQLLIEHKSIITDRTE